jgi:hypothetical protein
MKWCRPSGPSPVTDSRWAGRLREREVRGRGGVGSGIGRCARSRGLAAQGHDDVVVGDGRSRCETWVPLGPHDQVHGRPRQVGPAY